MNDEQWMREALREAEQALKEGEVPVGAVLVEDGRILARAHNLREALRDPTAHAELLAMREGAQARGDWRLNACTLYVTLEPCPMCAGAMAMARLGRCVFGAADPDRGCCGSVYDLPADPALGAPTRWQAGCLQKECERVLQAFFAAKRSREGAPPASGHPPKQGSGLP